MADRVNQHQFDNGLTLLAESMPHVQSVTMSIMIPAGFGHDEDDTLGCSIALSEMLMRGAGDRDSRALSQAFDNLGIDRGESIGTYNVGLSSSSLGRNITKMVELYADVIRRPHLNAEEVEPVQDLMMQDLIGLNDSPQEQVMYKLRENYYPKPLNRNRYGSEAGVQALDIEMLHNFYQEHYGPRGTIISVAGAIEWEQLKNCVAQYFSDWKGVTDRTLSIDNENLQSSHIEKETNQTHIGIAFPSVSFADPDYYAARGMVSVLSGGMSSRLFTEVREKRGLCYAVSARFDAQRDRGAIFCYAGSRSENAQETLTVTHHELLRMSEGVTQDELDRVQVSLKSSLVMQQESTGARAASMANDWFNLGRVRSVDEIQSAIEMLTTESIQSYMHRHPVGELTTVTLGPEPLNLSSAS